MTKIYLLGLNLAELTEIVTSHNFPKYTALQLAQWLYQKRVTNFEQMLNISKKVRQVLSENYEIGYHKYLQVQTSTDGTKKYLFEYPNNKYIETAYIPDEQRHTVCVSTQAGCRMGCLFCMTAKQGFKDNLNSNEILNQLYNIDESSKITNIVYMGMGEPFDNTAEVIKTINILTSEYANQMSPKRITVSTIGIIPKMEEFLTQTQAHIAVSMHNPFSEERRSIMPIENKYKIEDVVQVLKKYDFEKQRRLSFEYIMFKDFNDSPRHANALVKLLSGLSCRINLIRFHKIPNVQLDGSDTQTILNFQKKLNDKGIITTIRTSRGEDIQAACGLLSTYRENRVIN